jgi:hypothetical protein
MVPTKPTMFGRFLVMLAGAYFHSSQSFQTTLNTNFNPIC